MNDNTQPDPAVAGELLTVAQVAAALRVSTMTIYRMIHAGQLDAVRVGRSFRPPTTAILTLLSEDTGYPDPCPG